ncbi:MAG: hypothetical protein ACRDK3_05180 [Actinomycetota bacterium]
MKVEVARSDKLKALIGAIALAVAVALLVPPAVEAATQKVKSVKGSVTKLQGAAKIKDTTGANIKSRRITAQGLFDAPGSPGALDVRTFGAGNGFLGAGDCTATAADGLTNVAQASDGSIITGILMTGSNAQVTVTADAVGAGVLPLLRFETNANNPNEAFALGNGLKASDTVTFTCTAPGGGDGTGNFVLIGQDD